MPVGFEMDEIFPIIEEGIKSGGRIRFYPRGKSMLPLIREGIDSVIFEEIKEVKKYDLILYLREDGTFVLHRVIKISKDEYTFCADNLLTIEKHIKRQALKAKVTGIYRGETFMSLDSSEYLRYSKRRVAQIYIRKVKNKIKRIIGIKE